MNIREDEKVKELNHYTKYKFYQNNRNAINDSNIKEIFPRK